MTAPQLHEILLFLLLAGILVPLMQRLRINPMIGFLVAGYGLGPNGLARVEGYAGPAFRDVGQLRPFADMGILFLMFMIGLELSPARLWALKRHVLGTGVAQVCVSAGLAGALAWMAGIEPGGAAVVGMVLAMSSTAVAMQLLSAADALQSPLGQRCLAILMLQDLAVVPLLLLVDGLGSAYGEPLWLAMAAAVAKALAAIAVLYAVGRRVARPLLSRAPARRQPEVFVAVVLLVTLGIAAASAGAGLSMALGALLAGLLFADTEFRHEIATIVEPFKGLFLGLFFVWIGMGIDLHAVVRDPALLLAAVGGLFLLKGAVVAALLAPLGWRTAVHGGALLGQGGEFAFIVLAYAEAARVLVPASAQFVAAVVGLSMVAAPVVAAAGALVDRTAAGPPDRDEPGRPAHAGSGHRMSGHVIIGGYGRVGRLVAGVLDAQGIDHVALDRDRRAVMSDPLAGTRLFSGDVAMPDLLQRLDVERAAAVVLTLDDSGAALHAVDAIRRRFPDVYIAARARDEQHAGALKSAGATEVVCETLESSLQLAAFALGACRVEAGERDFAIHRRRNELLARIDAPASPRGEQ